MSSGDIKHVFIFHKDGELRPTSSPQSEVVVAGEQDEEKRYHKDSKHTTLTLETNTIRMRSACINSSIVSSSNRATHVWPDPVRGINAKMLRYVVENLSAEELCWKGTRQLEEVSGICIAIWSLQCSRKPFQKAADSVLQKHKIEFGKVQEAEWLTIITFVLGKDDDLKQHLKNLIWQSGGALKCPIEYLQDWVNKKRVEILEEIYTFFQERINEVCARDKQVQSGPLARIYFNLTDNSGQSGAGVNFKYGWATHRKKREKVLEMSPQELTCNVLRILKGEAREEGVHSGQNGGLDSTPHTVARQDTSQPNGLKSGRGGDFLELVKTLIKSPHKKEINNVEAEAIQNIVIDAESEMEKWKEMKQVEETKELTEWRDTEQKKWIVGFLALNQMNGGTISPRNPQ